MSTSLTSQILTHWIGGPLELFLIETGPIAQSVEHRADNAGVSGAIPLRPTIPPDVFF